MFVGVFMLGLWLCLLELFGREELILYGDGDYAGGDYAGGGVYVMMGDRVMFYGYGIGVMVWLW